MRALRSTATSGFIRRQSTGGFSTPWKHATAQQPWDHQVSVSFLLGLDWAIAREWETVRDRERQLKQLRKAASSGTLGKIVRTPDHLRAELAVAERDCAVLRRQLEDFKVLEDFSSYEEDAASLARQISDLNDENTLDRQVIANLKASLESETPPPRERVDRMYEEAGILLPDIVSRRIEEVREFHSSIIRNRQLYLREQLNSAESRIEDRNRRIREASDRRSRVLGVLQSHGALDQFVSLQAEYGRTNARLEALRQEFETAETLEDEKVELKVDRGRLQQRLQREFREDDAQLREAILGFEDVSWQLYENAGTLVPTATENGPSFEIEIHGKKSAGIANMQIFCFDMMLMKLCAAQNRGPGFLVHDSHLFDPVDERQVATALRVGSELSEQFSFQYIVTLNSDQLPPSELIGFDPEESLNPTRLTDASEDGGLFGFRFA